MSQPDASRVPLTVPPICAAVSKWLSRLKVVGRHVATPAVVVASAMVLGTATSKAVMILTTWWAIVLFIHSPSAWRMAEIKSGSIL